MLDVKLDPDLEAAVARQARREKKSKAAVVRAAVEKYLEDAEDYRAAMEALRRNKGKKAIPLAEVKKRLGLAD